MDESFVHLHVHSDYTLSKGASKVKQIVAAAKSAGMPAVAVTDDANMFGAMEFSKYAAEAGVQPIVGVKLWFKTGDKKRGSVILLAQDSKGYENVCSILAHAHRPSEGSSGGDGVIDTSSMEGRTDGVIALTGGRDGAVPQLIREGRADDAEAILGWLLYAFGDRLYVEVCRNGDETPEDKAVENRLIALAYSFAEVPCVDGVVRSSIPLVATTEVWYTAPGRHDAFEILKSVEGKGRLAVQDGEIVPTTSRRFHMRSTEDMRRLFADLPEAFENAANIARRCAFKVKKRSPILPTYASESGLSEVEELRAQARAGLEKRLVVLGVGEGDRAVYDERLEFELGVIEKMKFPGYFLIVSDFIKWAKANGIPVGPGRGSGAGSLVAYSLSITDIDPLRFGLLFERFLNPERVSMPDFDVDFCQDRREEVIRYVREKYGEDYVSMIATFGEIKSKTAVKDVGRVMLSDDFGGYGFGELDRITKLIPMEKPGEPKKLAAALKDENDTQFKEMIESEEKYRVLIKTAMEIEGLFRTQGLHAAGVIIAGQKLEELVPVGFDVKTETPVCQFNMKYAEEAGLVKFDFLGLKTLSVIREALANIKETTGEEIDLERIPLDDAPTFEMLSEGHSNGVFQFESDGMKRWFKELKPNRFEDLIALNALFRPGPMEMIPTYVACKHGHAEPNYPEPSDRTRPVLEETFGIMVYQEQVMQVAQVVAGYSLGQADMLRRAMGKKIASEMAAQRVGFIEGSVKNGIDEKAAGDLFDLIAKFAEYGFNKSHAAAYAYVAYHTAYLKKHYPAQFMAALLTYETNDPDRMSKIKEDMDAFGVPMLPPCIDKSDGRFKPERLEDGGFGVRFGLTAIKGVSGDLAILKEARKAGPFKDLPDFHKRAGAQFNKGQLEKLTEAGAFDRLAINRYSAANVLAFLSRGGKKAVAGQADLFGGTLEVRVPKEVEEVKEWGNKIDREFAAVGFYFNQHPLDVYEPKFRKAKVKRKASLRTWMTENNRAELKNKKLAGLVEIVDRRTAKKSGKPYISAKFAEKHDTFYVNFFGSPEEVEAYRTTLENAKAGRRPVIVVGDLVLQPERDDLTIWGRHVQDADEALAADRGRMRITLSAEAVILSLDEQKAVREATERHRQGLAGASDVEAARAAARESALRRKIGYVHSVMEGARADDDPNAVEVHLAWTNGAESGSERLEGLFVVNPSMENTVKATDGVTSVAEEV